MALDRNYDQVQSASPLKLRVPFDIQGQYDKGAEQRLRKKEKEMQKEEERMRSTIGGRKQLRDE